MPMELDQSSSQPDTPCNDYPPSPTSLRSAAQELRHRVSNSAIATATAARTSWDTAVAKSQAMRREVRALLATDLRRLPDVQQIIRNRWHQMEATSHVLINQVIQASADVRNAICALPQMQGWVSNSLANTPEWGESLQPLLQQGLEPVEAFSLVLQQKPSLQLPTVITSRLVQLHDVQHLVSEHVMALEHLSEQVFESLEANMHRLMDFQRLVTSNLNNLPNVQLLLKEHHLGRLPALKEYANAPRWLRDNHYIHTGYRPESLDLQRTFESLFYLHNEFGNIWTHLIGAISFALFGTYITSFVIHDHRWLDKMTFFFYWSTAIGCMLCSAVFHTMFSHSYSVYKRFVKLDYIGIVVLVVGSIEAAIYFTFYCHPWHATFYMAVTLLAGLATAAVTLSSVFDGNDKKALRVLIFSALGCTAIFPTFHYSTMVSSATLFEAFDFFWLFGVSIPLYLSGAFIYVKKWPECFYPGRFDIWFHSHQLWHVFVMAAAYAHYRCIFNMSHYRQTNQCLLES
eukprot:m.28884 g.28884  ORF g.28884 m.28884 type:complete len:515 (+) comp11892_c0_seq1:146-1690(+)